MGRNALERQDAIRSQEISTGTISSLVIVCDSKFDAVEKAFPETRAEEVRVSAAQDAQVLDLVSHNVPDQYVEIARCVRCHDNVTGTRIPFRGLPVDDVEYGVVLVSRHVHRLVGVFPAR